MQARMKRSPRRFTGAAHDIDFDVILLSLRNAKCNPFTDWRGQGRFYLIILRFVECQMQPFHTSEGPRSILLSLFKVCGMPDATLSQIGGVEVDFT